MSAPASATNVLQGSCLCGKVRYEVREEDFSILSGQDVLKAYRSSPDEFRHFCSECGSPVFSEAEHRRGILSIRCGLLDGDPGVRPAHHLYVDFKAPWYVILDGLPEYAEQARPTPTPAPGTDCRT